jgi:hypothetical protein
MKLPLGSSTAGSTLTALEAGGEDADVDEAGLGNREEPQTLGTGTE